MSRDMTVTQRRSLLDIANVQDAIQASEILSKSGLIPDKFKGRPADILVAMQWGAELGSVQPLQALNGIAVVNGTPSIYGDLGKALVMRQADLAHFDLDVTGDGRNMEAHCEIRRQKPHGVIGVRRTFSMADAERGGLAGRGPWKQYPGRMLMWRAFWLAARDVYADVLSGLQGAEELEDLPYEIKQQKAAPVEPPKKVVVDAEPVEAPKPQPTPRSADSKVARFRGEELLKKTKADLMKHIAAAKAERKLDMDEFVGFVQQLGIEYKGGTPLRLSLQDLRDIYVAITDDLDEPDPVKSDDMSDVPF